MSFHSDGNNYEDYLSLVIFWWQTFRAQNFLCNILGISPTTCCSLVMSVVTHLFSKEEHIDMGKTPSRINILLDDAEGQAVENFLDLL